MSYRDTPCGVAIAAHARARPPRRPPQVLKTCAFVAGLPRAAGGAAAATLGSLRLAYDAAVRSFGVSDYVELRGMLHYVGVQASACARSPRFDQPRGGPIPLSPRAPADPT